MTDGTRRELDQDLREFWVQTIAASRELAMPPELVAHNLPVNGLRAFDVRFSGFGGQRIAAWLIMPEDLSTEVPVVIEYVGHGGGRGYAHEHLLWAGAGFAHFVMDVRGQASEWSRGDTDDAGPSGPGSGSFFTRGIEHRDRYYYRRLFTDGILAVDAVHQILALRNARVVVTGASQGGGVALAVASLRDDISAVMADVPAFASHRKAIDLVERGPYLEIAQYLAVHRERVEQVFDVLRCFDTMNLVLAARAPALFSLGGRDDLVAPETIRDVVAAYGGPAELIEYPFNGHEGGGALHDLVKVEWLSVAVNSRED